METRDTAGLETCATLAPLRTGAPTENVNGPAWLNRGRAQRLAQASATLLCSAPMKFSELVRRLEEEGFRVVKQKGSVRYYTKTGHSHLIRVDFHGAKEVPSGTCHAILKAAGPKGKETP